LAVHFGFAKPIRPYWYVFGQAKKHGSGNFFDWLG
jgi:hypothetical protein